VTYSNALAVYGLSGVMREADWLDPPPLERREHRVRATSLRADRLEVVHHRHAGVEHQRARQRPPHGVGAAARERAHVLGGVHGACAKLVRELGQHALRRPVAKGDAPEPLVQLGQALEHEAGARRGGVAAVQQPVVEAEHRHDLVMRGKRRAQRGMIVDPEVTREPQ